jgi:hypothetical protein
MPASLSLLPIKGDNLPRTMFYLDFVMLYRIAGAEIKSTYSPTSHDLPLRQPSPFSKTRRWQKPQVPVDQQGCRPVNKPSARLCVMHSGGLTG